jgi:hypothetical protein
MLQGDPSLTPEELLIYSRLKNDEFGDGACELFRN